MIIYSVPDAFGTDSIQVTATNRTGGMLTDTLLVMVEGVNDVPEIVGVPDTVYFDIFEEVVFDLDEAIFDVEDEFEELELAFETSSELLIVSYESPTDSAVLFSEGFLGTGTLTITVTDTDLAETTITITLVVMDEGSMEFPEVINPLADLQLLEDFEVFEVAVIEEVFGQEGFQNTLSFEVSSLANLVVPAIVEDTLTLESIENVFGIDTLVISATNEFQLTTSDSILVIVQPVNDAPFFLEIPDTLTFDVAETLQFSLAGIATDIETPELLSITYTLEPEALEVTFSEAESILTLSSNGFVGTGKLTFTVSDLEGSVVTDSIFIEVTTSTNAELEGEIPTVLMLSQNYPNPFNPTSTIRFGVPEVSDVRLEVFNMLGQRVLQKEFGKLQAGWHTYTINASGLSSGVYFYSINTGTEVQMKRMTLIK